MMWKIYKIHRLISYKIIKCDNKYKTYVISTYTHTHAQSVEIKPKMVNNLKEKEHSLNLIYL